VKHRVVIIGGGFGGIHAAKALRKAPVEVVIVDRANYHLFTPLLYQVATASLSPADVSQPIRYILAHQRNVKVLLGEVTGIDLAHKKVELSRGSIQYDSLVVAAGSKTHYFGNDRWSTLAPPLKTIDDAQAIRDRILGAYERAEWTTDEEERRRLLTFVVVGGGPTGVELAGALAEMAHRTLAKDFRNVDSRDARVVLVEGMDRVLGTFPAPLPVAAREQLEDLGVEVRLDARVTGVDAVGVDLGSDRIEAGTILWAAGVTASELGHAVGAPVDRGGRVFVEPDLTVPGRSEVYVIGDLMSYAHGLDAPLAGVAQVAMQSGACAGRNIAHTLAGEPRETFRYVDLGIMATIGRTHAVSLIRGWKTRGALAWWLWLVVHLVQLVGFRNRLVVLVQWAWSYITFERSTRIIREGVNVRVGEVE
jgi:NADH:ubiquinone reductase (H+-translocating)